MNPVILHPILFALYPVLALFSNNVTEIPFGDTHRAFYAMLLIAIAFWGVLLLILKDWYKSALIVSLGLILFFNYGHIFSLIQGYHLGPILIGRTLVLVPLWGFILAAGIWWITKRIKNPRETSKIFNLIALVALLFPLYTITSHWIQTEQIRRAHQPEISPELVEQFEETPPDIYYIILDMHARADVLKALYDYDLTWFIDALEDRGFYVAYQSTSNYSSTSCSITSSLNFKYINYLSEIYASDTNTKEPLNILLTENKVFQILKGYGYQTVAFETGDYFTEIREADIYIKPSADQIKLAQGSWAINSFEGILVQSTMARVLYDLGIFVDEEFPEKTIETPYKLHRLIIQNMIAHLPDFSNDNESNFIFAHILAPHPPYVFGPNGEEIQHTEPFSLAGPGRVRGGQQMVRQYTDQLTYIDDRLLEAVDEILRKSDSHSVIIIQADHGPNAYTGANQVEKGNMKEQYGILNAYYFPNGNYSLLYPTITPVNSFRVLLNTYFNGKHELLPDESYIIPYGRYYEFIDVTERTQTDPLTP